MGRKSRSQTSACPMDMTPMIDCVFQLIIFFIVTIKLQQEWNPDIVLADSTHGPTILKEDPRTIVIEVDQRGWISVHNAKMSRETLRNILVNRYRRHGEFPILIRGDARTRHEDIRAVMDICTESGIWRINFAAVKERKT